MRLSGMITARALTAATKIKVKTYLRYSFLMRSLNSDAVRQIRAVRTVTKKYKGSLKPKELTLSKM